VATRFRVLGPVEARLDGHLVDLGPARQRCVLAALLMDANQVVPPDELAIRIWGENPPVRAVPTLRSYVSRLRSRLSAVAGFGIHRRSGGYVVQVDEEMVDVHRFRLLRRRADDADDDSAAALLTEARAQWRGTPITGLDTPWAHRIREVLHAEKLSAELDHHDVQLRRGEHSSALVELTVRAQVHPLDERMAGQLLLALYRSGRQAEALQHYQRIRLRLADELGADPGIALQKLHQQMLTADPALDASASQGPRVPVPRQLPAPPPVFTGRAEELAALDTAWDLQHQSLRPVAISAVGGCGGIGKTSLALHWSHRNLDRFPDGQLYANLRGFGDYAGPSSPVVVIRGFLEALGIASQSIPGNLDAQAALYRSLVAGRRLLVLLDNARATDQVVPLLPGSPTCTVIVTSRRQLSGLIAQHGARPLTLDALAAPDARQLLAGLVGRSRLTGEPDAADDILRCCAGLPLALSIVAARASGRPTFPLAGVAEELRDAAGRLDALDAGDAQADLRTVFSWSYHALSADAARLFRLLGLPPGPDISLRAAASLAGVVTRRVRQLLAELTRSSMLTEHCPGRFVLHDLLRAYAREQSDQNDTDAARHDAVLRLLDHYLHTGHTASRLLDPIRVPIPAPVPAPGVTPEELADLPHAATWFGAEQQVILAAVEHATRIGLDAHSWQLAWTIAEFLDQHARWHDYAASQRTALTAARRVGSLEGQAVIHRFLARAGTRLGAYADARSHLDQALDLHQELGDQIGLAAVHRGFACILELQGDPAAALPHTHQALRLYRACGDFAGQILALTAIGSCNAQLGDHEEALDACADALLLSHTFESCSMAELWNTLGYAHHGLGHHSRSIDCHRQSLALAREKRDVNAETEALGRLGDVFHATGDVTAARENLRLALAIHQGNGRRDAADAIERKLIALGPVTDVADALCVH
jgi:DNA-binding SARP family transcriptional activator